jgi:hypothetical protein
MQDQTNTTERAEQSTFPIPFTKEKLQQDILEIYLLQLRTTELIADKASVWALTKKEPQVDIATLWNPQWEAKDFGLNYSDISHTTLAMALEQQYDYAFHGIISIGIDSLEYGTTHTWIAAYLMDLNPSSTVDEWESYGGTSLSGAGGPISRCFHTCELANARLAMEGQECFSYFASARNKDNDATAFEAVTVRQMALLSGMEEMTIRTAASRKSANPLQTYKKDRQTLIRAEVAKTWLIAKNRYVPITKRRAGGDLKLETTQFSDINGIRDAIRHHFKEVSLRCDDQGDLRSRMQAALASFGYDGERSLDRAAFLNANLMGQIAEILQLPTNLLVLRAHEAVLNDDLTTLSSELASLKKELRASTKSGPAA